MECYKKKKKRELLVTSIVQVTLSYKTESQEIKGCLGKHFTFILLLTKYLYPSSAELFIIVPSHI